MRNRLCHRRNIQTTPRPFSGNRDAHGKHINLCVITSCSRKSPGPGFPTVEAFELNRSDRSHSRAKGFSKSFGGRLAQFGATQACDPERRAWSSVEEFAWSGCAPCRPRAINALPLPARGFRGGRGRGEWGKLGTAERVTSLDGI